MLASSAASSEKPGEKFTMPRDRTGDRVSCAVCHDSLANNQAVARHMQRWHPTCVEWANSVPGIQVTFYPCDMPGCNKLANFTGGHCKNGKPLPGTIIMSSTSANHAGLEKPVTCTNPSITDYESPLPLGYNSFKVDPTDSRTSNTRFGLIGGPNLRLEPPAARSLDLSFRLHLPA